MTNEKSERLPKKPMGGFDVILKLVVLVGSVLVFVQIAFHLLMGW